MAINQLSGRNAGDSPHCPIRSGKPVLKKVVKNLCGPISGFYMTFGGICCEPCNEIVPQIRGYFIVKTVCQALPTGIELYLAHFWSAGVVRFFRRIT